MISSNRFLSRLALASLAAAALACSKSPSAPTDYTGVNITVDAHATSLDAVVKTIKSCTLQVSGAESATKPIAGIAAVLQSSREARFKFLPGAMVGAGDKVSFVVDCVNASGASVASGSSSQVTIAMPPPSVTIKLAGGASNSDGGGNDDGGSPNDAGSTNGTACTADNDCQSGHCADGVCCNTACDGVCSSCKLTATKGTCTPYPTDTDPEMECGDKTPVVEMAPPPDASASEAGGSDAGAAEAGASEAGAAEAGASDAAAASDGPEYNPPDGGFMTTKGACAGSCNGAGACKYPGATKSCGKPWCNSRKDVGSFVCDGAGVCSPALSECTDYACDEAKASCHTNCSGPLDCQLPDYCSAGGQCLPKKVLAVACATDGECKSGHCSSGVCCNTACTGTGLSCNDPGQAGQCKCQGVTCAAGVACQIFYKDADTDTFGDANGTITAGTAKAGCMGSAPPAGFVADNTDCDDSDAMAHPGQTAFFGTQRKGGGFDYDCDGKTTKFTPEYPGGSCKYCGAVGSCDQTSTTCSTAGATGSFQCPQELSIIRALSEPISIDPLYPRGIPDLRTSLPTAGAPSAAADPSATVSPGAAAAVPIVPCKVCLPQCCGCATNDKRGFLTTIACGANGTIYSCGGCAAAGGASPLTNGGLLQQTCR
jgi:hypothetical protein